MTAGEVRVVVAPDSFKGSLPADEAAAAIGAGLRAAGPGTGTAPEVVLLPVADGGEGTVAMVRAAGWLARTRRVTGPTGQPLEATFAVTPPGASPRTAVVELAAASGLTLLPAGRPDPLGATTYGTGELVAAALDEGVDRVVLAVGGSATSDGGTGLAAALGARWLDADGAALAPGGGALRDLASVDVRDLDPRLRRTEVVLAADVDNPLTGAHGAARVYAAQKGADPAEVDALEAGLVRLAEVLRSDLGRDVERQPGAGAAGGAGAVALAVLGARLVPGVDLLLDLVRFDDALTGADLVVTGEGSVDDQTLSGKAPVGVARRAFAAGVPVLVLAGRAALAPAGRTALADLGVVDVRTLTDLEPDPAAAQRQAARLLTELARRAFSDLAPHLTASRSPT